MNITDPQRPAVVYLADTGTHLKIGRTVRLQGRMRDLRAELLHQVPDDPDGMSEEVLIHLMRESVVHGREWLARTDDVRDRAVKAMDRIAEVGAVPALLETILPRAEVAA